MGSCVSSGKSGPKKDVVDNGQARPSNGNVSPVISSSPPQPQVQSSADDVKPGDRKEDGAGIAAANPSGGQEEFVSKLLLLGAGESGKSTIFRQIKSLYGEGFTTEQRKSFRMVIDANIIQSMQTLVKYSDILDPQYNTKVSDASLVSKNFIAALDEEAKLDESISRHVATLWADDGIRKTFQKSSLFQLPDSAEYFFQRVEVVAQPGYVPSFQDLLRCRARTTGIQQVEFTLGRHKFKILDVGGQRNERKKWKQCFEGVTAVLFVAALSEYDQVLFEDGKTNRMHEALHLFSEICNSHWFKDTSIILFLNKGDIFEEKIKKTDLKQCFPEFEGGPDYYAAAEFVDLKFREKAKNRTQDIYSHVTTATDTENIQHVFDDVKDIVIKMNLRQGGLLLE